MNFIKTNWIAIGSLVIATLSFLYTFFKTRKSISVTWDDNFVCNFPDTTFVFNSETHSKESMTHVITSSISIVNPSSTDISFFDLRIFDPKTNLNIEMVTQKTIPSYVEGKHVYQHLNKQGNNYQQIYGRYQQMDIPERKFGILKGNSFTKIDIIGDFDVLPDELGNITELTISFKIPKWTLFKDQYAITNRKKYKSYSKTYDISGWNEQWQSMLELQQQMLLKAVKDAQSTQSDK